MKRWLSIIGIVACMLATGTPYAAADEGAARQAFAQGSTAFQAGEYAQALEHFLAARRAGMDSAPLRYNLGATYYRLQRYDEAKAEFSALTRDASSAPAAWYNLGLIALAQDDRSAARNHFRRTLDSKPSPALRGVAEKALHKLGPEPAASRGQGIVSVAAGYDDNVTLATEAEQVGVSESGDAFGEFLAGGRYRLSGTDDDGVRVEGGAYLRAHADVDRFDQQAGRIGLARTWRSGLWSAAAGGHVDLIYLDGERFETIGTATLQGTRALGGGRELWLRYRASRIEAGDGFEQLTGWRHRARAEARLPLDKGRFALGYELEYNDREDLRSGVEFSSQSPLRNSLYGELSLPVPERWQFTLRGEYRNSAYPDDDLRLTPTGLTGEARDDDRYEASVRAAYRIKRNWQAFGQYVHTDNRSNFSEFEYRRNEAQVGLEIGF